MRDREVRSVVRYAVLGTAVLAMWVVATVPSGFSVVQLLMFAGPGMVLAIGTSWTAHAFRPDDFDWEDALAAGWIGAAVFPPVVGLFVAWAAAFSPNVMIVLLVLSSWTALAIGMVGSAVRSLAGYVRRRAAGRAPRRALPHLRLLD